MSSGGLTADDISYVTTYATEVLKSFGEEFKAVTDRFKGGQILLGRFGAAIESVLKNGWEYLSAVNEAHNELCVASALLADAKSRCAWLEYEPLLPGCAKTIDFRATAANGQVVYVDVKTIKPKRTDRWDQFERATAEQWFPESVHVLLSEKGLGGEIWHGWFTARDRMLQHSLELEQKISSYLSKEENALFVLALCGDGFDWHVSHLEDFVAFYSTGVYRWDDSFSQAERKDMADKNVHLDRTISRFAYFERKQAEIRPKRVIWGVRPPRDGF
jgi:hypothetical protein